MRTTLAFRQRNPEVLIILRMRPQDMRCPLRLSTRWRSSIFHDVRLIDGTPDPSDDVEFMRLAADTETVENAREATEEWLPRMDKGDIDGFYDQATSESFRGTVPRSQFHTVNADFQNRVGLITSRQFLLSTHLLYAPGLSKGRGNYVLFSNRVTTSKNSWGQEFLLLVNDGGEWRVQWMNYGS